MGDWKRDAEKPVGDPERSQSAARLAGFLLEVSLSVVFFVITCNIVLFLGGFLLFDLLLGFNWVTWVIFLPLLLFFGLLLVASANQMWGKVKEARRRVE